jgi:hypothetical protein
VEQFGPVSPIAVVIVMALVVGIPAALPRLPV